MSLRRRQGSIDAQACGAYVGDHDVAGVAEVMNMHAGQTDCLECGQPDALTEVAVMQDFAGWASQDEVGPLGANI
jgi:hypothetical protein